VVSAAGIAKVEPITTARALRGPFDYLRPDGVGKGSLLVVPFGRRDVTGVVVDVAASSEVPAEKLVAPRRVLDERLPPELVDLAAWMAEEYCSTFARSLQLVLPPTGARAKTALWAEATAEGLAALGEDPPPETASGGALSGGAPSGGAPSGAAKPRVTERQRALLTTLPRFAGGDTAALRRLEARGLVTMGPRSQRRAPSHVSVGALGGRPALTGAQAEALRAISRAAPGEQLLLHGVTGSGKTEVYLGAVEEVLARGGGAIVLVPEIALTPQIVSRFVRRFGDTVAVLHSKLSKGERYDEWQRLRTGEARVCVGPRSAVFAPIADLQLIVIDEEHDPSYKHEGDPRYDARHVAARRGATLVCGSATPRPESAHALRRVRLPERVDGLGMPPVEVLDMRGVSAALHPDTVEGLHGAGKAIVMLNRRGWSNFLTCRSCGHVWMCPHCDVSLVLHRAQGVLACHHCGHRARVPTECSECRSVSVARHGAGTERLEHELAEAGLPVWRLDADVKRPGDVLAAFEAAPAGVLVGTQMVAKGHDFPDVTLAVVLDADATLRFPDFRAEERTFALVAQLAGRAGRGQQGGRVLVQTLAPEAPSIVAARRHDADGFLEGELARRQMLRYPPFSSLVKVVTSSAEAGAAHAAALAVREELALPPVAVLGPAPLFRLRDRERSQLIVKAKPENRARAIDIVGGAVARIAAARAHKAAALSVDVDPQ
jgi:primosomal protein N' (replication factor Y) (superfamily II helicase)